MKINPELLGNLVQEQMRDKCKKIIAEAIKIHSKKILKNFTKTDDFSDLIEKGIQSVVKDVLFDDYLCTIYSDVLDYPHKNRFEDWLDIKAIEGFVNRKLRKAFK